MSTQILGFFNDSSLNRAKGQVGHWCIYTNTCTWATQKRIRLTSICGTWVQDGAYPKQGVVFCFCFIFSSEYFSFTFFSHVPCDYQNLFFGLNAFWYFITWLHSKLSELKKESSSVCETWIPQDRCHLLSQRQFSASFWIISLHCSLCQSLDQRNTFQSINATWSVNWIQNRI